MLERLVQAAMEAEALMGPRPPARLCRVLSMKSHTEEGSSWGSALTAVHWTKSGREGQIPP